MTIAWIGTSWKMTKTIDEARAFVRALAAASLPPGVQPFVLPAHTSLAAVRDCLPADSSILLGAQNAHWTPEGAGTGEISMRMAADAGARLVEIGHSERRTQFGETDATVSLKARAAVDAGLTPLVCVGEPAAVRDSGAAGEYASTQVRAAFSLLCPEEIAKTLVAYEPIWAIGESGRPATRAEVSPVMGSIAREITQMSEGASCRALLYGGSVDTGNAGSLLEDVHTNGLFVGRAAWDVEGFLALLAIGGEYVSHIGEA